MGIDEIANRPHPHASAYYGLASIVLSGIFLLMALPALDLANTLQRSNYDGFTRPERQMAAIGGYAGAGLVILLGLTAAGIAVVGIRISGRTGEPAVLCVVSLLLGLFAVLVWIGCAAAWHSQSWYLFR